MTFSRIVVYLGMVIKYEKAEMDETGKFITLNGILWAITKTYHYDDYGVSMDTFTIMNFDGEQKDIYSYDEGETFTFDAE